MEKFILKLCRALLAVADGICSGLDWGKEITEAILSILWLALLCVIVYYTLVGAISAFLGG